MDFAKRELPDLLAKQTEGTAYKALDELAARYRRSKGIVKTRKKREEVQNPTPGEADA